MPIGSIISAGVNLLQGAADRRQQTKNIEQQKNANRELAKYGYDMDMEQWKRQNEYNTPLAQMERFKAAGLNQNLIYGQGTSGNAAAGPSFNEETTDHMGKKAMQFGGTIDKYNQQALVAGNLKQQRATLYKTLAEEDAAWRQSEKTAGETHALDRVNIQGDKEQIWRFENEPLHKKSVLAKLQQETAKLRSTNNANQNAELDLQVKIFQQEARKQGLTPNDFMYVHGMTGLIKDPKMARTRIAQLIGGQAIKGGAQLLGARSIGKAVNSKNIKKAVKKPTWAQDNKWGQMRNIPNY